MKHPPGSKEARRTGSRLAPEGIAGALLTSAGIMVNGIQMLGYDTHTFLMGNLDRMVIGSAWPGHLDLI